MVWLSERLNVSDRRADPHVGVTAASRRAVLLSAAVSTPILGFAVWAGIARAIREQEQGRPDAAAAFLVGGSIVGLAVLAFVVVGVLLLRARSKAVASALVTLHAKAPDAAIVAASNFRVTGSDGLDDRWSRSAQRARFLAVEDGRAWLAAVDGETLAEASYASMSVEVGERRVYRTEFVELVVRLVGGDQTLEIGFVPMNPRLAWPTYDNARDLREALEARGLRTGHDG